MPCNILFVHILCRFIYTTTSQNMHTLYTFTNLVLISWFLHNYTHYPHITLAIFLISIAYCYCYKIGMVKPIFVYISRSPGTNIQNLNLNGLCHFCGQNNWGLTSSLSSMICIVRGNFPLTVTYPLFVIIYIATI